MTTAKSIFLFVVFAISVFSVVMALSMMTCEDIGGYLLFEIYCAALAVWCYAEFKMMHLHKDWDS